MTLAEDNLRLATLTAIVDAAAAEMKKLRAEHTTELVQRYEEEGTSSFKVKLPDGTVVASVNLRVPQREAIVNDEQGFIAWVEANYPGCLHTEIVPAVPERIIPAVPEQEVKSVPSKRMTELMGQFELTEAGVVDKVSGALVDGMTVKPAPPPSVFEIRYEKGTGRNDVAAAYRRGQLSHVVAGSTLAAVTAGPVVERRLEAVPADPADVDVDDLGPEYSDGYQLPGEPFTVVGETVANVADDEMTAGQVARAALEEHADELADRYAEQADGGSPDAPPPVAEPADERPSDPWGPAAQYVPDADEFEPGDWDLPSNPAAGGW